MEELDYETEQKKVQAAFTKDLMDLLVKYKADLGVDCDDLTIEVQCQPTHNKEGDWIIPYTYFSLPRYLDYKD